MLLDPRVRCRTASGIGAGVAGDARHVRSRRARCRRQCTAALPGAIPEYDPVKKDDVKRALKAYPLLSVRASRCGRPTHQRGARRCRHRSTLLSSASWTRGLGSTPHLSLNNAFMQVPRRPAALPTVYIVIHSLDSCGLLTTSTVSTRPTRNCCTSATSLGLLI
ncbi:hypothetical protein PBRA_008381 [Plasmodiophora brassicae]|uniref:Uncharacterized protein n=1 Tax=Plasmodiophora brassicae TaxID=37360 RepID=A0A0G4J144_PLABS|nr:hypothetical protein PBRA_008381 [Plasmodiophora brassicae]